MMIDVRKVDDHTYQVTVDDDGTTNHTVTVDPDYHDELTDGDTDVETLLESSFEFLLDRESNRSILSRFDLEDINRYFPEYEDEIEGYL
ncbi:MAG: hypothetical protein ABEL76_14030 [Bradymonadaceae bacterium]